MLDIPLLDYSFKLSMETIIYLFFNSQSFAIFEFIVYILNYFIFSGRLKVMVAPFPVLLFSAHILPSCASIMFLQIYRPRPVPEVESVINLSNNFGSISLLIPCPSSLTPTIISLLFFFIMTEMLLPSSKFDCIA